MNLRFLPAAREELDAAASYLEDRVAGLGGEFLDDVERAGTLLCEFSQIGRRLGICGRASGAVSARAATGRFAIRCVGSPFSATLDVRTTVEEEAMSIQFQLTPEERASFEGKARPVSVRGPVALMRLVGRTAAGRANDPFGRYWFNERYFWKVIDFLTDHHQEVSLVACNN